jgi:hypothetical protein
LDDRVDRSLVPTVFEKGAAEKYSHSAAIFPEVLLLEGLKDARRLYIGYCPFVMVTPFGWRQFRPAHATGGEIFTVVSHYSEECVIGRSDCTFESLHDNSHNIGLDQTPDLRFQPPCQFTDFCFRLFALGHLDFEALYVYQCLIR